MKNTAIQAQRRRWGLLDWEHLSAHVLFFNFVWQFNNHNMPIVCVCVLSNPFLVYCVSNGELYKQRFSPAPLLLLSDGWIRGDQKGGDRERVSAAFSSSLFSPHSANVQFPLTAWLALDSLFLSLSLSRTLHFNLMFCAALSLFLSCPPFGLFASHSLPLFSVHHSIHPCLPFFFNPMFCTALAMRVSF